MGMGVRAAVMLMLCGGALFALPTSVGAECPPGVYASGCMRVTVPLDRDGVVPGRVRLLVAVHTAGDRSGDADYTAEEWMPGLLSDSARPPLLVLAGERVRSSVEAYSNDLLDILLAPERLGRDVIAVDLRGSGHSGRLRCPSLRSLADFASPAAGAACAAALGPRREFYTAADSADDIDAVRDRLGVEQIAIYAGGVDSQVALAYARRYPTRVDRLVLASPVGPDGIDPLRRSSLHAAPRILRRLCGPRACRSFTADPARDLARLARRLGRSPARGRVVDRRGRLRPARIGLAGLFRTLLESGPTTLRLVLLPAAIRSALRGDAAPLLRMRREVRIHSKVRWGPREAAYAVSICEESAPPWNRDAAPLDRRAQASAFVRSLPANAFAPLGAEAALASPDLALCERWPAPTRMSSPAGPLPAVPALVLAAGLEIGATVEDARAVARGLGGARLIVARKGGRGLLDDDDCVWRAVRRFLASADAGACRPASPHYLRPLAAGWRVAGCAPSRQGDLGTPWTHVDGGPRDRPGQPGRWLGGDRGRACRTRIASG